MNAMDKRPRERTEQTYYSDSAGWGGLLLFLVGLLLLWVL